MGSWKCSPSEATMTSRGAMADPSVLLDRALGAYLGLAIGDALGATVEFMRPREIQAAYGVHRDIVGGGWLKLPRGQVTDDTTMSLALGEALLAGGRAGLDGWLSHGDPALLIDIANAYARWLRAKPVDCGNTCRRGIQRWLREGTLAAPPNPGDGGNGAAMRNLPVTLATLGDDDAFERVSIAQARITHHHPLSDAATIGLGHLTRRLIQGADSASISSEVHAWVAEEPAFSFQPYRGRATAYVVDTVQTVLHAFVGHEDFEDALITTVNLGDDADTTGALVGMLAGARCGARALPLRWLQRLQPAIVRAITDQTAGLLALSTRSLPVPGERRD